MKVSVVIPAFNEERLLGESLRQVNAAMTAFARRNWPAELIVCDNNSTDHTAEVARAAGANVVFEPINQIGRARNRGAEAATGDWLIFIDADTHPSAELFDDVAAQIETGRCLAGGVTIRLEDGYPTGNAITHLWNFVSRTLHWMAGSFIFCETVAFRKLGGFDITLYASEELDLSKRLKKLARTERKQIVILHRHPILTSARKMHLHRPRTLRLHDQKHPQPRQNLPQRQGSPPLVRWPPLKSFDGPQALCYQELMRVFTNGICLALTLCIGQIIAQAQVQTSWVQRDYFTVPPTIYEYGVLPTSKSIPAGNAYVSGTTQGTNGTTDALILEIRPCREICSGALSLMPA